MKHSFHRLQMVRWDVSWIVGWDLDRLLTCKVCWSRHNDVWKCWLWIWCWWWFNRRGTLLRLESWHQEYRLDLGWLHIFEPSELDFASWRRSFQLSVLASLIASVASWQTSIHCCRFWWIVSKTWFRVQILAHMSHPRFRFLARFYFLDVGCYSRDENIIETRYTERYVWFVRKIINFRLNLVGKTSPVNVVTSPSSSSWDDRLVVDLVIYFNDNWKMVGTTSRLC